MQGLAVLVVDAGQTLRHGCVALLLSTGIGLESPFKIVPQIVNLYMNSRDVA